MFDAGDVFDHGASESEKSIFLPVIRSGRRAPRPATAPNCATCRRICRSGRRSRPTADTCLGTECPRYGDCFVTLMRQRAAESDVVIVNHHLLCADASVRKSAFGEVIPSCTTLVVDEAHQLEDVATQYFGVAFSNYRVDDFAARRGPQPAGGRASLEAEAGDTARDAAPDRALARRHSMAMRTAFFTGLVARRARQRRRRSRASATPATTIADYLEDGAGAGRRPRGPRGDAGADAAAASTRQPRRAGRTDRRDAARRSQRRRAVSCITTCGSCCAPTIPTSSTSSRRAAAASSCARRRSTSRASSARRCSIASARSSSRRRRSPWTARSPTSRDGSACATPTRSACRPSSTSRTQALLYLPRRMPPPKSPAFAAAVARGGDRHPARALAGGRSCCSPATRCCARCSAMRRDGPALSGAGAGQAPRSALLDEFRSTPNAVLLATSSFWQGVDVVGEALSCVIIDKLPFASPGDPVTARRASTPSTPRGGDAFGDYQVPLAILALQQGLGRLIRHRSDRGVLAVLDPRLRDDGLRPPVPGVAAAGAGDPRPRCHQPFLQVSFPQRPAVDRPEPSGAASSGPRPGASTKDLRRLNTCGPICSAASCAVAVVCWRWWRRRLPRASCAARCRTRKASRSHGRDDPLRGDGREPQDADEDRQERRLPAGRSAVGRLQGDGVEGRGRHADARTPTSARVRTIR